MVNNDLVTLAAAFARRAHSGQARLSGEPYYTHAAAVADAVASLGLDDATVAAAYLHDVCEEANVPPVEISRLFGNDVRRLVEAVTNLSRLEFASEKEYERANLGKMFLAMAGDVRVVIIKLADRLDNSRTLEHLPAARRRRYARETLLLFAPLADRLGLGGLRWELEDLSFRHLEPETYRELASAVATRRAAREKRVGELCAELQSFLGRAKLPARIQGRAKNLFSIYQKMVRDGRPFDEVYDLLGVRVIVPTVADCYRALALVHSVYPPLPGRYKDYIARPKANLYQSLHTTVKLPDGDLAEVQIRTAQMDAIAEFGVAAHWRYKPGLAPKDWGDYPALRLMRAELARLGAMPDPEPLADLLADLRLEDIFVFTPKGDVKRLPRGATPVDFAYAVHTSVGHRCVAARVNGRLVSLRTPLETGDVVAIQTSPHGAPRRDWLTFVVSSSARRKIRSFLRRKERDALVAAGRDMLAREARRRGVAVPDVLAEESLTALARSRGLPGGEELLLRVGEGALSAAAVIKPKVPAVPEIPPLPAGVPDYTGYVEVSGMSHIEIKLAGCCRPAPPGRITGYVTNRGKVSVHREDCPTLRRLGVNARRVRVAWQLPAEATCAGVLEVTLSDGAAAVPEIVRRTRRAGLRLAGVNMGTSKAGVTKCTLHVRLATPARLKRAAEEIAALPFVAAVASRVYEI